MKKTLLGMVLIAGSAFAAPGVHIGIGIGAPAIVQPACPGPGYAWVDGYYGPSHVWVPGYWRAPAVVAPPRRVIVPPRPVIHDDHRNDFRRDDHRNDFRHDFRR